MATATTPSESSNSSDSHQSHDCVRTAARGYMRAVLGVVESSPLGVAIDVFGDLRGMIDAAEARRLAVEVTVDGDSRAAERKAAASGRVSKRQAARRAKAAAAVKKNSALGDMVDGGDLSSEQLDTIADAMRTDESAATDQSLIDAVAAATVDQGKRIGRDWAARMTTSDRAQSEHDRQRAARRAAQYHDKQTSLAALKLEGDGVAIHELWMQIQAEERRLYRMDGGRDVPTSKHRRTRDQRLFDAAVGLLTGRPEADGGTGDVGDAGDVGGGAARSGGVPVTVVGVGIDKLVGDADECAELIGHGPIADSVAIDLIAKSNLIVNILGLKGETLWWGRSRRRAPTNLRIALAMRDKGCVRCGAPWQQCHAHHLMPWNAPGKGETNLDDMAFVCESCHHDLHDTNHTLFRKPDGTWATRPATAEETPPRRGPKQRPPKRQSPSAPISGAARPPRTRQKPKQPKPEPGDADDPAAGH